MWIKWIFYKNGCINNTHHTEYSTHICQIEMQTYSLWLLVRWTSLRLQHHLYMVHGCTHVKRMLWQTIFVCNKCQMTHTHTHASDDNHQYRCVFLNFTETCVSIFIQSDSIITCNRSMWTSKSNGCRPNCFLFTKRAYELFAFEMN